MNIKRTNAIFNQDACQVAGGLAPATLDKQSKDCLGESANTTYCVNTPETNSEIDAKQNFTLNLSEFYVIKKTRLIRVKTPEEVAFLEAQFEKDPKWSRKTVQYCKANLNLETAQIYKWGFDKKMILKKNTMNGISVLKSYRNSETRDQKVLPTSTLTGCQEKRENRKANISVDMVDFNNEVEDILKLVNDQNNFRDLPVTKISGSSDDIIDTGFRPVQELISYNGTDGGHEQSFILCQKSNNKNPESRKIETQQRPSALVRNPKLPPSSGLLPKVPLPNKIANFQVPVAILEANRRIEPVMSYSPEIPKSEILPFYDRLLNQMSLELFQENEISFEEAYNSP
ncbi:unnamed protein product [Moneuplotes crassus]|uniref:Homeobox domain-containing protein n=1 Tax=Euplotes crassus TaxID=5936 RepID=A0AAD1XGT7_EUPCR|nr:unnamed protein product [Moneuplotes crassus]